MNKSELLTQLEARLGSRGAAAAALDAVLDEIQVAVAAGERVTLTGFGTFEAVARPARTGRNPRTGAPLPIAASTTPRFRAGAVLRAAVAGASTIPATTTAAATSAKAAPAKGKTAKGTKAAKAAKAAKPAKTKASDSAKAKATSSGKKGKKGKKK